MKQTRVKPLRLGFVPLTDCAPIVMARELGLFAKYGLAVTLSRELGWATVRDKIIYRELEASQAVAGMVFTATSGRGSIACECLTALVLNLNGNAITLSTALRERGATDAGCFRRIIEEDRGRKTYTIGMVSPHSSHHFLLRQWLAQGGIHPDRDVHLAVVPPPQMFGNLRAGHLDGFCVGEPWNSVAIQAGAGFCAATSRELSPRHPEKVLMVRADFARSRATEHVALVAALIEAAAFCDCPENRDRVAETLAQRHYLNVPVGVVRASLCGPFDRGQDRLEDADSFHIFHRQNANVPDATKAQWVFGHLKQLGLVHGALPPLFRADIYQQAIQLHKELHEPESSNLAARDVVAA